MKTERRKFYEELYRGHDFRSPGRGVMRREPWGKAVLCLVVGIVIVLVLAALVVSADTETKQGTLSWNPQTNALIYRWTNWNSATNQTGWTTTNQVAVLFALGTNWAGVRAEKGSNVSPWTYISTNCVATNAVGVTKLETRTMAWQNGTWSPWITTTFGLVAANNFMQQWRPVITQTNWWILN
jgi:hypothetical protein